MSHQPHQPHQPQRPDRSDRPGRVLAYVRVSSAAQGEHGTSLDAQRAEISRFCAAQGHDAPTFFVEVESGSYEKRERRFEQIKLMSSIAPGDLVVVAKQDRWSRDTLHYLQSTREIIARGGRFFSLAERFDPSTPEGAFAATMMAAVAEQERARIFYRTVGRRRELRDEGRSVEGHCPFGYRRERKTLVVYEPEARLVRRAFELCVAGRSLMQIREALIVEGLRRDKQVIHKYLRDRVYLGEMRDTRGIWHATHPAIVSAADFENARASLLRRQLGGRRHGRTSATNAWLLRGLAVCAKCGRRCGSAYSPRTREDPLDGYYACLGRLRHHTCDSGRAKVRTTDQRARAMGWARLVELRHDLARRTVPEAPTHETSAYEAERAMLDARRKRVVDLAIADVIGFDDACVRTAKIDAERRELDALEEAARKHSEATARLSDPLVRRQLLADVNVLSEGWRKTPTEQQREILAILAERVELDGESLTVRWRQTADLVSQPGGETCLRGRLSYLAKERKRA